MGAQFPAVTLTIAAGAQASGEYALPGGLYLTTILAPATLPETVVLQRAEASGGTFRTMQQDGIDILVSAGRCVRALLGGGIYRLYASSGVTAAQRQFVVTSDM